MTTTAASPAPLQKNFLICRFTLPDNSSSSSSSNLFNKISKKIAEKVTEKYNCRAFKHTTNDEIGRTEDLVAKTNEIAFHLPLCLQNKKAVTIGLFKNNKRIFSYFLELNDDGNKVVGCESGQICFKGYLVNQSYFTEVFQAGYSLSDPSHQFCHFSKSACAKIGLSENINQLVLPIEDSSSQQKLFNYPLMEMYAFTKNMGLYTATERTTESTLTLPVSATTIARISESLSSRQKSLAVAYKEVFIGVCDDLVDFVRRMGGVMVLYEATDFLSGFEIWRGDLISGSNIKIATRSSHILVTIQSQSSPPEVVMGTIDTTTLVPNGNGLSTVSVKMFSPNQAVGAIQLNVNVKPRQATGHDLSDIIFFTPQIMGELGIDWLNLTLEKQANDFAGLEKLAGFYANPPPLDFNTETNKREFIAPFRPSTSKSTPLLRCIPINTHSHTLVVEKLGTENEAQYFRAITTGVPADHFLSFDSGGLYRLLNQRNTLMQQLDASANKYTTRFITPHTNRGEYASCQQRRTLERQLFELTHTINLRKMHILPMFVSQLATVFVGDLSNVSKVKKHINHWISHGYMVCMEGLLSTLGKELGMIEDCFGMIIEMHRVGLYFEFLCGTGIDQPGVTNVSGSQCLEGTKVDWQSDGGILVQVHLKEQYYSYYNFLHNRKISVKPILFQVGVDIQQWGSNVVQTVKSSNMGKKIEKDTTQKSDPEMLNRVNKFSFNILNKQCHLLFPGDVSASIVPLMDPLGPLNPIHVHSICTPLFQLLDKDQIRDKQKVEVTILHYATQISQQCGAGSIIFCKSGKDRTGMQVTYQQSLLMEDRNFEEMNSNSSINTLRGIMRLYGTRIFICEKNVGQPKYAFNSIQLQFMPDVLRPPTAAIAGVLKGGAVFRGEGMIES